MAKEPYTEPVQFPTLSFRRLAAREDAELHKLLQACKRFGFFYLDLRDESLTMVEDWSRALDFMQMYFAQDLAQKMQDDRRSDFQGYEPTGTSAGSQPGHKDYYETLKVAADGLSTINPPLASVVQEHSALFERIIGQSRNVLNTLLESLSDCLEMVGQERFEQYHRKHEPSLSNLTLFRYPKMTQEVSGVGHNKHTDLGSLTLLFSSQRGLQFLYPETQEWHFVDPRPGHVVINIADSIRFLSDKRLYSCVHRVIPTEELYEKDRYSMAFFLRPENNTTFTDPGGNLRTAESWHNDKFDVFRQDHAQSTIGNMLTGGMERTGAIATY